jgi:uncharacterized protein (TIGR03067 family)
MHRIRWSLLAFASLLLLAGCSKSKDVATSADLAKLQGSWNVVSGESNGEPPPKGLFDGATVRFSGKTAILMGKEGTFEIDESKQPHWIEFNRPGSRQIGIYELSGDDLKFCVGPPDDRPKEFKTKPRTDHTMMVLQRKK